MTGIGDYLCRRLRIPATPTELAAMCGRTPHSIRGVLWHLQKRGKVRMTDRRIPKQNKTGRQHEHLWVSI